MKLLNTNSYCTTYYQGLHYYWRQRFFNLQRKHLVSLEERTVTTKTTKEYPENILEK